MLKWSEMGAIERNRLVAELVVGLKPGLIWDGDYSVELWNGKFLPEYSSSIAAAWEMIPNLPSLQLFYYGPNGDTIHGNEERLPWHCVFYPKNGKGMGAFAKTAPEAICLAALKIRGVEIE